MIKLSPNKTNGLSKDSAADCFQVRSVSEDRLMKKIGNIYIKQQSEIKEALKKVLSIQ